MADKLVVVVGVGALGSHLVQFLRNEKAALKVIDMDRVEGKNVLSQFHGKPNVGQSKTASLQKTMAFLYGTKVEAVPHKLVADNVEQLLGRADLVIDALDNLEARTLVQKYVRGYNCQLVTRPDIGLLHGALAPDGQYGRVVWDRNFVIDGEAGVGGATCEDGAFLPFIGVVSAYLARAAQVYLQTGQEMGFEINPTGVFRT